MRVGGLFPIADGQGVIPSDVFIESHFSAALSKQRKLKDGPSPLRCSLITAPFTVRVCNRVNR